jgi:hypothetical protein
VNRPHCGRLNTIPNDLSAEALPLNIAAPPVPFALADEVIE